MLMEHTVIYAFDLFGTFIFAITGAVKGVRCKLDILGVVVFACTVGCGGGMFRDMLIGATPVAALSNSSYILICVGTGLAVFFLAPKFVGRWRVILFSDALGLGVFTAIGVAKGALYGMGPIGQLLCGVFTAVGGGMVRDIMSRSVPSVLTSDFYATASLIGGIVYLLLEKSSLTLLPKFLITTLVVFVIRLVAIKFRIQLPVARTALPVEDHLTMQRID
ncbi:trimeric intracellular cation channel family protein [Sphaerochaeta sp. PS]|uniref:trimeric intracellular cation channel family protein n=1 Tax=Sphaerochaeta sp. PS TaxID=3076336 RepID=UPI0028A48275|nr:trimeric intracellular cation channel family protein [Sphaerochaeta sp. PS]MDT4762559.1 trimeric intracellular cation channel family protein [Sphaerochaeta sp. PS]